MQRTDPSWPSGPWDNESDRYEWETEAGFPAIINRSKNSGGLCGYVAVPPGHPYHGLDYEKIQHLEVHGGVTYAEACQGDICHVPKPGESDNMWWIGFDCSHGGDLVPMLAASLASWPDHDWTYKDVAYVKHEVEQLAKQLQTKSLALGRGI